MSEREYEYFLQKDKECHQHSKSTTTSKESPSGYSRTSSARRISPYKGGMRVGVDVSGQFIMSIEEVEIDDEPDVGITYGYDYVYYGSAENEIMGVGLGATGQLKMALPDFGKFRFDSYYGLAVINISPNLALLGRFGYGLYIGDDEHEEFTFGGSGYLGGGQFYSVGSILSPDNHVRLEVSYAVNKGVYPYYFHYSEFIGWDYYSITIDEDIDVTYSRINVYLIISW